MTPQAQIFHARPLANYAAEVRATPREDATWSRPVFRPPPLEIPPFRPDLPYSDSIQRTEPWAAWSRASTSAR
jgi:hypothetical protein